MTLSRLEFPRTTFIFATYTNNPSIASFNMGSTEKPIILYHYETSPYSKQVLWYLALKGIKFQQCVRKDSFCLIRETV